MSSKINMDPSPFVLANPELAQSRFKMRSSTRLVPQRRAPRYAERGRDLATNMLRQPLQQGGHLYELARRRIAVAGQAEVRQSFALAGLVAGSLVSPAAFVYGAVSGRQGPTRLQAGQEAAGACMGHAAAIGARLGTLLLRAFKVIMATVQLALVPVRLGLMPVALTLTALLVLLEQAMRATFGAVGGAVGHLVDFFSPPRFVAEEVFGYDSETDPAAAPGDAKVPVDFISTASRWSS